MIVNEPIEQEKHVLEQRYSNPLQQPDIKKIAHVMTLNTHPDYFMESLDKEIKNIQYAGYIVEVQYQHTKDHLSALVIGRRPQNL